MPVANFLQPLQSVVAPAVTAPPPPAPPPPPGGTAGAFGSLNGFSVQTQQQTEWCWAAVSTSVSLFLARHFGNNALWLMQSLAVST
jgi:hypothetical protein